MCAALRAMGIQVWFDQNELRGGDAWDAATRKQIKTCALFVLVLSANSHARVEGYFRLEWKIAIDRSHLMAPDQTFLLPVVIDETPKEDERIPDRFREPQWPRLPAVDAPPEFVERMSLLLRQIEAGESSQSHTAAGAAPGAVHHGRSAGHASSGTPKTPTVSGRARSVLVMGAIVAVAVGYVVIDKYMP